MILVQLIRGTYDECYDVDIIGTFADPFRALAVFAKKEVYESGIEKVFACVLNTDHVDHGGHIVDDWFSEYDDLKQCLDYLHKKGLC